MGAFVLPNKEIPDQADLRSFIVPGEAFLLTDLIHLTDDKEKEMVTDDQSIIVMIS